MEVSNSTEKQSVSARFSLSEKVALALSVIALLGVVLALMGLGVALSAEIQFGIPHTTLFGSSFELLQVAAWCVANLFSGLTELLSDPMKYLRATFGSIWIIVGATAIFGVVVTTAKYFGRARLRAIRRKKGIAWIFRKPSISRDSYRILWARAGLFGVMAAALSLLAPIIVVGVVLGFCLIVVLVPALSVAAGDAHIKTYVVGPDICFPIQNRKARMDDWNKSKPKTDSAGSKIEPPPVATCVSILDGASVLFSGRVAWATSESILLFDPCSGEVRRMSLKDRDVKMIGALPVPPAQATVVPKATPTQPNDKANGASAAPREG